MTLLNFSEWPWYHSRVRFLIGYVVPGFIDIHAHWGGFGTQYPATSWEHETFLAYGITTLHKYVLDHIYSLTRNPCCFQSQRR